MHKLQCCHAALTVSIPADPTYLLDVYSDRRRRSSKREFGMRPKIERQDREGKTMNLIRNYRNWRTYRQTVAELERLSNHNLADLGIERAEIKKTARRAVS